MLIDIRSEKDREQVSLPVGYKNPKIGLTSGCFDLFQPDSTSQIIEKLKEHKTI